ncbi:hypothetical protein IWQ56_006618, partial [Coemansia nantahalensis]
MASTTGNNLVRRPDPFNGSGDVRMWIRSMLHYVRSANPTADDVDVRLLVNAIIGNVTGAAEAWVDTQRDENCALLTTSKEFIDGLGKQFEPFDRVAQAENELERAMQTSSVLEYAERFQGIVVRVGHMSDDEKRRAFLRGLKPRIRGDVKKDTPKTFEDARRLALHADRDYDGAAAVTPTPSNARMEIDALQDPRGGQQQWQGRGSA